LRFWGRAFVKGTPIVSSALSAGLTAGGGSLLIVAFFVVERPTVWACLLIGLVLLVVLAEGSYRAKLDPGDLPPSQLLDHLIRQGQAVRDEIVMEEQDEVAAGAAYIEWFRVVEAVFAERFPAYADELAVREDPQPHLYSGPVAVIRLLNAKLGVLGAVREKAPL
jgi:hypothetical protein